MRKLLVSLGIILATLTAIITVYAEQNEIELTTTNFASLRGEVTNDTIEPILKKIYASDSSKTFYLYIDSPGGDVFQGLRLVRYLQSTKHPITCVTSTAISMAFVIFQTCNTRVILDSAVLMTHEVATSGIGKESLEETKNRLKSKITIYN